MYNSLFFFQWGDLRGHLWLHPRVHLEVHPRVPWKVGLSTPLSDYEYCFPFTLPESGVKSCILIRPFFRSDLFPFLWDERKAEWGSLSSPFPRFDFCSFNYGERKVEGWSFTRPFSLCWLSFNLRKMKGVLKIILSLFHSAQLNVWQSASLSLLAEFISFHLRWKVQIYDYFTSLWMSKRFE